MTRSIADKFYDRGVILQDPSNIDILARTNWWLDLISTCVDYKDLRPLRRNVRAKTLYTFADGSHLETIKSKGNGTDGVCGIIRVGVCS